MLPSTQSALMITGNGWGSLQNAMISCAISANPRLPDSMAWLLVEAMSSTWLATWPSLPIMCAFDRLGPRWAVWLPAAQHSGYRLWWATAGQERFYGSVSGSMLRPLRVGDWSTR